MSGRAGAGEAACCVCAQVRAATILPDHHRYYHHFQDHHHHHGHNDHVDVDNAITFIVRVISQAFHDVEHT